MFDDLEEEEVTCSGMGKCPLESGEGVTEADLKFYPTEDKCTFKRKLCLICYKEAEEEREPVINKYKDKYKCNAVDETSLMEEMYRYWDFVDAREQVLKK